MLNFLRILLECIRHVKIPILEELAVHCLEGGVGGLEVVKRDEAVTARFLSFWIAIDLGT